MNPAMKRVYEKCGYQHEGVARRKFWRDGRWHDADLYAILAEDWRSLRERADRRVNRAAGDSAARSDADLLAAAALGRVCGPPR